MTRPLSVKGLLFDLDGTLVDSAPAICDAASASLIALGANVSPAEIRPHLGAPLDELYTTFIGDEDQARFQSFVKVYIEVHDAHPEATPPALPGVFAGLEAIATAFALPCAVATTKPSDRARQQICATGLAPHFRHVQGTDEGMAAKPAPDVVHRAAAGLDIIAPQTWMIGDTERDVRAAITAGATAVVVAYDAPARERALAYGADFIIGSLEELLGLLAES